MITEIFILSFLGAMAFGFFCYFIASHADWLSKEDLTKLFGGGMALFCFLFLFSALNSADNLKLEKQTVSSVSSLSELVACEREKNGAEICGIDKNGNKIKFCQFHASDYHNIVKDKD